MKLFFRSRWGSLIKQKKGGITVEFVTILPLCLLIALFIWQMAVSVMAIMETETLLRDEARLAATTGNLKQAEKRGKESFDNTRYYQLDSFKLKEYQDQREKRIVASAVTKIQVVFIPSQSFNYKSTKDTVIIH
ncbi:TadE/TadG family type IV pilus assembly protein [Kroppenstedtia eburnea]|uniref:TadE/TadG family type IV pilus assembly protein n=1 Tax=Kroppenstedtia eburnea TaxID=714067 RepID=UPI003642F932